VSASLIASLPRYRWGMGLLFCMFTLPVLAPYYASKGLSMAEFFYVEGIYRVAYFCFNAVTGYISDRWSRKKCLLLGAGFWCAGAGIIIATHGFWGIVVGEIVSALGMSFFTSPGRAYLYDALLSLGRAQEHPRLLSRQRATEHGCRMLAMVAGGFLFLLTPNAPQIAVLLTTSIAFYLFTRIDEPPLHKSQHPVGFTDYAQALRHIRAAPGLLPVMLFGAFMVASTVIVFWGMQPAMRAIGFPVQYLAMLMACAAGLTSFFSYISHTLIARIGFTRLVIIVYAAMLVALFLLGLVQHPLAILAFALNSFAFVITTNAFEDIIQQQVPSHIRAATLSFYTMLELGISAPLLFACGFLSEHASLAQALLAMAMFAAGAGGWLLWQVLQAYKTLRPAGEAGKGVENQ
jgi:MFS family permease